MSGRPCPKCGVIIKHRGDYYRHVKRCGTTEHRVSCPYCPKTFSRKDDMNKHVKQKHPTCPKPNGFRCRRCQKSFHHEENLLAHQRMCGAVKKFKCPHPGCNKTFTRKAFMEHHRDHDHVGQSGGNLKRKASEGEEMGKKYLKGKVPDLPDTAAVQSMRPDKEAPCAEGAKLDSFFYPQTKSQQRDFEDFSP